MAREMSRRRSSWALITTRGIGGDRLGRGGEGVDRVGDGSDRVAVACEASSLPLEDVDLRLHEDGAPGERDELRPGVGNLGRARLGVGHGQLLGELGALLLMAGRFGLRLTHEHVDLGQLAVERRHVRGQARSEILAGRRRLVGGCGRGHRFRRLAGGSLGPQSSGIRIQPWRIA
jgi:hypothetical protein